MADDDVEWIPLRQAVNGLADVYHEALKGSYSDARTSAITTMTRWLAQKRVASRSASWGVTFAKDGNVRIRVSSDTHGTEIQSGLWRYVQTLKPLYADWVTGEFLCQGQFSEQSERFVTVWAYDVVVERNQIPILGSPRSIVNHFVHQRGGRPAKWRWDDALCSIIASANTVNGLPEGHGAQAEIGRMLSQWFRDNQNGEPAASEIGARAAKIMTAIGANRK